MDKLIDYNFVLVRKLRILACNINNSSLNIRANHCILKN
jgi:hypothetical protein